MAYTLYAQVCSSMFKYIPFTMNQIQERGKEYRTRRPSLRYEDSCADSMGPSQVLVAGVETIVKKTRSPTQLFQLPTYGTQ